MGFFSNVNQTVSNDEIITARDGKINLDTRLDDFDVKLSGLAVNVKNMGALGTDVSSNDDWQAIQDAFNTGKPVYFPSGTYYVSKTIKPYKNKRIYADKDAIIKAKSGGVFDAINNFPSGDTGLKVLFDTKYLDESIVINLVLDCNSVTDLVGIAATVQFQGSEEDACQPMNIYDNMRIKNAKWGVYGATATGCWGSLTGSIFRKLMVVDSTNGLYIGANQDDITIQNARIHVNECGIVKNGMNLIAMSTYILLTSSSGVGVTIKKASNNITFINTFIESNFTGVSPIILEGDQSWYTYTTWIGLTINIPNFVGATWIKHFGKGGILSVKGLIGRDWNISRPDTYILSLDNSTDPTYSLKAEFTIDCNYLPYFIKYKNVMTDLWANNLNACNVKIKFKDDEGEFRGISWISYNKNTLGLQTINAPVNDGLYQLDICKTNGICFTGVTSNIITKTSAAFTGEVNKIYYLMNHISNTGNITLTETGSGYKVLVGRNVLSPGQIARFVWNGTQFVQIAEL